MIDWNADLAQPDLTLKRFCWLVVLGVGLQLLNWKLWLVCAPVGVVLGMLFG